MSRQFPAAALAVNYVAHPPEAITLLLLYHKIRGQRVRLEIIVTCHIVELLLIMPTNRQSPELIGIHRDGANVACNGSVSAYKRLHINILTARRRGNGRAHPPRKTAEREWFPFEKFWVYAFGWVEYDAQNYRLETAVHDIMRITELCVKHQRLFWGQCL